jgi:general secretion pathway protein J
MPARRHSHGFTLVEVLVALLILAVLSGMAWRGIDGMSKARDASQADIDRSLRLNTVVAQWEADLGALYASPAVPPLAFDGATLRLVRSVDTGAQMVAWSLRGQRWQRWAGPIVTRAGELQQSWLQSQQLLGNEPGQLLMMQGVSDIQVYFFRGNAWSNSQSTGTDISGVRLVLALGEQTLTRDLVLQP